MTKKTILGLVEEVTVQHHVILAKIDTGATTSSIDASLAATLNLGPSVKQKMIRSAHGKHIRPYIHVTITLKNRTFTTLFTIVKRDHMRYKMLIGNNILKHGFLIDPSKPYI